MKAITTTISKEFEFSASHRLTELEDRHPCGNLHGHNYTLRVFLRGPIDFRGFIVDYRKLADIKNYIDTHLDHKHLNDLFPQPTVELMAGQLLETFRAMHPEVVAVEMSETPKTLCRAEVSSEGAAG